MDVYGIKNSLRITIGKSDENRKLISKMKKILNVNKVSIIGCGLIGSSILRAVEEKKLVSKISVYDKSSSVTSFEKKFLSGNLYKYF